MIIEKNRKKIAEGKFLGKFSFGLMFKKNVNKPHILESITESILFSTIHTYFVFTELDIIWLDSKNEIVDIKKSVKPFSVNIKPKKPAKYIIETKPGFVKKHRLKNGQKLSLI